MSKPYVVYKEYNIKKFGYNNSIDAQYDFIRLLKENPNANVEMTGLWENGILWITVTESKEL